ncbi:hypothetical protein [Methylibium sp.]|uniref:hypothetical protein n=1 Tax=Methylibium sp. TaxID=2067992 RepID=UPI003D125F56
MSATALLIHHSEAAPPHGIPPGYRGPAFMPGTGRPIYWTGRVAIGLLHEPAANDRVHTQAQAWVQDLLIGLRRGARA